jgi:hypothetical protein
VFEIWLKPERETETSVEKKGSNKSFTYTLKQTITRNGERQLKKKCISASEFVEIDSGDRSDQTRQTLHSSRVCTIDKGVYMIFDYYEHIDG